MRWFLAALAMLALAGCGQAAMVTPSPTPAPTVAPTDTPVPPTQTPYVIVVTATPAPSSQPAPYPTTFPPASQAQTQAMLALVDQAATVCAMTPDAVANTVLGAEQVLATSGVTYGSVPDVDAYLRDVIGKVQTGRADCGSAFGSAIYDVLVQRGIEKQVAPGSYVPVQAPPPTPTIVDAPAE